MTDADEGRAEPLGGAGTLLLSLLAGLVVLLAGLTVVAVLPFVLLMTAFQGDMGSAAPPSWPFYLWTAFAFAACIVAIVAGLGMLGEPRPRRVAGLLCLVAVVFLSFPHFWLQA